jgi:hypothetical protein
MILESTLPLTEIGTRGISWGKDGRYVGLTTLPPFRECLEIWQPQPPGFLRVCTGIAVPLPLPIPLLLRFE